MTSLERLRLATALVHVVPGASLELRSVRGGVVVVGHEGAADLDPCALRRVVLSSASPRQPNLGERVDHFEMGGALSDCGGGIFSISGAAIEQRWIASLLPPERVAVLLDEVAVDGLPDDVVDVRLRPDRDLAVTLVVITVKDPKFAHAIDDVAARAAGACFVDELRQSMSVARSGCRDIQ